jgi:hypothetical protein
MYYKQVKKINESLKKTRKAIISLGCSFVEGQGAVDQYIYDSYKWTMERTGVPMEPVLTAKERQTILDKHGDLISYGSGGWNWTFMEYKNAFVNVLCENYFNGEYTPINFGLRGRGNRASIKSLYFWPQINWDSIDEIVVLYVPSGQERFDFLNDEFKEHAQFHCMWPHWKDQPEGPRRILWNGYGEAIYSDKSATLEQISNIIELKNWCKVNNAKLVITPGFDRTYNRSSMLSNLKDVVQRSGTQEITTYKRRADNPTEQYFLDHYHPGHLQHLEQVVDMWPWDKMFKPQGCDTFMDLCLKQEGITNKGFWDYNGVGTPNGWVTVCCHPSAKGHDLFAKELYTHIKNET